MTKYLLPISILIGAFFIGAAGLKIAHNNKWSSICSNEGFAIATASIARGLEKYNAVKSRDALEKACANYYFNNSLLPQNHLK